MVLLQERADWLLFCKKHYNCLIAVILRLAYIVNSNLMLFIQDADVSMQIDHCHGQFPRRVSEESWGSIRHTCLPHHSLAMVESCGTREKKKEKERSTE